MVSSYKIFLFPVEVSCWLPERVRGERREQEDGIREPGYSLASRPRGPEKRIQMALPIFSGCIVM